MKTQERIPFPPGYRMPAEWEKHEATWLAWPHNTSDWPGKFAPIPWVFADVVRHLHRFEQVYILVNNQTHAERARKVLTCVGVDLSAVRFFIAPTNRVWTRDYAPVLLVNDRVRKRVAANWRFNAWAKYGDWKLDDAVSGRVLPKLGIGQWKPVGGPHNSRVVLEGGSIDVNGAGLLLTTEECLLSRVQERNPGFVREDYERVFARYLGVRRTLWLRNGIAGDDTHGHVDDLARFVDRETIVTVVERDRSEANHEPLKENLAILRKARGLDGSRLRIVGLPMPEPVVFSGQRLPASYANFYIANNVVLVPVFNDPNDRLALNTIRSLFPTRRVVGICCLDLVLGLGTLHCMTQQVPALT
jgi:agmatine deiminase